ncbi:hypothetical protein GCM10017786_60290 [Amycolatopsis deserti]|uniref:Uncharacterized protein n=1 Tax=Amycolatopsis deserti TaxID=185696 RepID=A0ABQ3JHM9_9PSEU|nr:hypothetical protein [Amycolatopsis deserti]GHF18480.1 hypothetical protein GCM10017786_60290 [Amycolatopsis deserti]
MAAGWAERRALAGSGRLALLATAHLCRRHRRSPEPLVRLMCQARDDEVAHRARTTLESSWDRSPLWREKIWHALRTVLAAEADRLARDGRQLPWVAIVALVDVRPELVTRYDQRDLARKLLGTVPVPEAPYVAAAVRRVLRKLPPGPAVEVVREQAARGDLEAAAAVADARYPPPEPAPPPQRKPHRKARARHDAPGGTGTAGSGGFSTGGFNVHGV